MEKRLTHFDNEGKAIMVDVGDKADTKRTAVAQGKIKVGSVVYTAIKNGSAKKGDVLATARIAAIMAAKKTWETIPLCHMIALTKCTVDFEFLEQEQSIKAVCKASTYGKTGVEMEALTGVSVALLTIYDMCKAMERSMEIGEICLVKKDGGKSGLYKKD